MFQSQDHCLLANTAVIHTDGYTEQECVLSVIIPAFNATKTIIRAMDSVRSQDLLSFEIIIIDDGSVDDTVRLVQNNIQPGEQIHLIEMKENSGVSAARNAGIRAAKGKLLAFLDADDVWLPEKIARQIEAMGEDPAITLISCGSSLVSESGVPLKEGHQKRVAVEGFHAWKTLLKYNFIPTPTVLTYRRLVQELGGFDESLSVGEDLDLWIKLARRGKVKVLKNLLVHYYDTPGSLMKRHCDNSRTIVASMLERHLTEERKNLSDSEIRHIRGYQSFHFGCDVFFSGNYFSSIPSFLKSSFYGVRPVKSLTYIPRAFCMELIAWFRKKVIRNRHTVNLKSRNFN
jgi:glycosyltransferase involved in cell wall biosynthesis